MLPTFFFMMNDSGHFFHEVTTDVGTLRARFSVEVSPSHESTVFNFSEQPNELAPIAVSYTETALAVLLDLLSVLRAFVIY
jgi:hypothetical protein